jgi:hypothetical protein
MASTRIPSLLVSDPKKPGLGVKTTPPLLRKESRFISRTAGSLPDAVMTATTSVPTANLWKVTGLVGDRSMGKSERSPIELFTVNRSDKVSELSSTSLSELLFTDIARDTEPPSSITTGSAPTNGGSATACTLTKWA